MNAAERAMLAALQRAYQSEAIFRPSNADRWMTCHGSVQMIAKLPRVPQKPGQAARQGTGAHTLAETVLINPQGLAPEDFVGRNIVINNDPTDTIFVDDEMGAKITEYVGIVEGYRSVPGTQIFIEYKLSLAVLDPDYPLLNECRGTGDVVAVNLAERWAISLDLKYGVGVPVAGDSRQPKLYLLMVLLTFGDNKPWAWGGTTVFQPRLPVPPYTEDDHYKAFIFQPSDITGPFMGEVLEAMHAALGPDPVLVPSLKACRWCEARSICPALQVAGLSFGQPTWQVGPTVQSVSSILQPFPIVIAGSLDDPRPVVTKPRPPLGAPMTLALPAPTDLSPDEISNILKGGAMFDIWFEGVKHRAAQLLAAGTRIPNYYLKSRTGNRRWKVPREVVEEALLKLGLKPTDIYTDPKIKSPKQIEDVLPKLLKGAIESLHERPPGAPTLVAGDDLQQQVSLQSLSLPTLS